MNDIARAFTEALRLVWALDGELFTIVSLSMRVTLSAVAIACLIGLPLAAWLAVTQFPMRRGVIAVINALMGIPPVVVGLLVYLMLSRTGPFGVLGLLFTPTAMIIAQTILVIPIVTALTRQTVEDLNFEYDEYLRSLGLGLFGRLRTLLYDGRASLATATIAGLGRAIFADVDPTKICLQRIRQSQVRMRPRVARTECDCLTVEPACRCNVSG